MLCFTLSRWLTPDMNRGCLLKCPNEAGELFGSERLAAFVAATADRPLHEMLTRLRAPLCAWHGAERFDDDISVLALEVL